MNLRLPDAYARLPELNRKHLLVRGQNGGSLRVAMAILGGFAAGILSGGKCVT